MIPNKFGAAGALILALLMGAAGAHPLGAQESPSAIVAGEPVVIYELLTHTDPPQVDTIELWNPAAAPADISNWCLAQGPNGCNFFFPPGTVLPGGGYLVLDENVFGFGLSELGETISLIARDANKDPTGYKHVVTFGAAANGVALGRVVTSDGREFFAPQRAFTPGAANGKVAVGPVVIAELMYNPAPGLPQYVELLNLSNRSVPLFDEENPQNRWRVLGPGLYALPAGLVLGPLQSLYVAAVAPAEFRAAYDLADSVRVAGPTSGFLALEGEPVTLQQPDTPNSDGLVPFLTVDELDYKPAAPWPALAITQGTALQRARLDGFGQEPGHWRAAPVPLEAEGPAIDLDARAVWPAVLGRRIEWSVAWEWRVSGYRILRSAGGRSTAEQVGGTVLPLASRHLPAAYRVSDTEAADDSAWNYWIEVLGEGGGTLEIGPLHAPPITRTHLPLVGR